MEIFVYFFLRSTEIGSPRYAVHPEYLRVYNDSRLLYSRRMVMVSSCLMNFRNYPMDTQVTQIKKMENTG